MIIDSEGRIAFHTLRFREDGGTDYVQYDFDGKVLYIEPYRRAEPLIVDCKYP